MSSYHYDLVVIGSESADQKGAITAVVGDHLLIASGTRLALATDFPFVGKRILDADQQGHINKIPRDLIVGGAGVAGIEYASRLAALGVKVTIIEQQPTLLDFADQEIIEALCCHLRRLGVVFRLGEKVTGVEIDQQGLVRASLESGKRVYAEGLHMCQGARTKRTSLVPYSIYTIPEISMVGKTERELAEDKIPYTVGIARYDQFSKGQMAGDDTGMVKILFDRDSLKLLGVHAIGDSATEIVRIGQTLLASDGSLEPFRNRVFTYPDFAEAYKVAALNGLNKR